MLFLLWSLACDSITVTKESHESDTGSDADGDGFTPGTGDCDDTNADIYPGAPETEDDLTDSNCDGTDNT